MFGEQKLQWHWSQSLDNKHRQSDFEPRVKEHDEALARVKDLWNFSDLISVLPKELIDQDIYNELMEHASEVWLLTNRLSAPGEKDIQRENVIRFKAWQEFNPQLQETNWQHSLLMVKGLVKLVQIFPYIAAEFDVEKIIKLSLWHDAVEFDRGDIDNLYQDNQQVLAVKQQQEQAAMVKIRTQSHLGVGASRLLDEYKDRRTSEAILTKILDALSGNRTFYQQIVKYLGLNLAILDTRLMASFMRKIDKKYAKNGDLFYVRIDEYLKKLNEQMDVEKARWPEFLQAQSLVQNWCGAALYESLKMCQNGELEAAQKYFVAKNAQYSGGVLDMFE